MNLKIGELPSGKEIADVVYLPKRKSMLLALIIELKWNKSSEGTIGQIKKNHYPTVLKDYDGEIVAVGINYDAKTKEHSCVIERMQNEIFSVDSTSKKKTSRRYFYGYRHQQEAEASQAVYPDGRVLFGRWSFCRLYSGNLFLQSGD